MGVQSGRRKKNSVIKSLGIPTLTDNPFKIRCTTTCLLCFLSNVYPSYTLVFQGLISLDFSSHYIHMYRYGTLYFSASGEWKHPADNSDYIHSSLVDGASSHKNISQSSHPLLRAYYNSNVSFFSVVGFIKRFVGLIQVLSGCLVYHVCWKWIVLCIPLSLCLQSHHDR